MKQALKIACASFLITAAAIRAAPALAEPAPADANVSRVRTADLDLASTRDRAKLDLRLARAAREVCGEASDADLAGGNMVRYCIEETLANARAQRDQLLASTTRGGVIAVAAAR